MYAILTGFDLICNSLSMDSLSLNVAGSGCERCCKAGFVSFIFEILYVIIHVYYSVISHHSVIRVNHYGCQNQNTACQPL